MKSGRDTKPSHVRKKLDDGCAYCKAGKNLEVSRAENINAVDCFVIKCPADVDGSLVITNTKGMPAYCSINYCPMCGKKMS